MFQDGLLMLVILNPFAQMVYLGELMNETDVRTFVKIFVQATILTTIICLIFAESGEFILYDVFQVRFSTMRIFGGLIVFSLAFVYIVQGAGGLRLFRGEISEIAQQIALPLMIGPGILWISIKIGNTYSIGFTALVIAAVMAVNALLVLAYHVFFKRARGPVELAMIKYFAIAMRVNALMIGALGIDMILSGISEYIQNQGLIG